MTQPTSDRARMQIYVRLIPMSMLSIPEVIFCHSSFLSVSPAFNTALKHTRYSLMFYDGVALEDRGTGFPGWWSKTYNKITWKKINWEVGIVGGGREEWDKFRLEKRIRGSSWELVQLNPLKTVDSQKWVKHYLNYLFYLIHLHITPYFIDRTQVDFKMLKLAQIPNE